MFRSCLAGSTSGTWPQLTLTTPLDKYASHRYLRDHLPRPVHPAIMQQSTRMICLFCLESTRSQASYCTRAGDRFLASIRSMDTDASGKNHDLSERRG